MTAGKKAAILAVAGAVPTAALASICWLVEAQNGYMGWGYGMGDRIFRLGAPLTLLLDAYVVRVGHLRADDHWWAVPIMIVLFTVQWIIWSQLLVHLLRGIAAKSSREAGKR